MKKILQITLFTMLPYAVIATGGQTQSKILNENKQLTDAVHFFFETQQDKKNHIISPLNKNRCASLYLVTLTDEHKKDMADKLNEQEIDSKYSKLNIKTETTNLTGIDLILTRNKYGEINNETRELLKDNSIILGDNILEADTTEEQCQQREEFKNHVTNTLNNEFRGDVKLDYNSYFNPIDNEKIFLKIVSALHFNGAWRTEFDRIRNANFIINTGETIKTPFMSADILDLTYSKLDWSIHRIFYKDNYAMDIILPGSTDLLTKDDQIKYIINLVSSLNNECNPKACDFIKLNMPLFQVNKKSKLTNYFEKYMLPHAEMNHIGFFGNKVISGKAEIEQKCMIKVDEIGTVVESITDMEIANAISARIVNKRITINKPFFFIISKIDRNENEGRYMQKDIIMIGKIDNPSLSE